jgi:hypothetical protein
LDGLVLPTAADIAGQHLPEIEWLVRPWIVAGGLTELDGKIKAAGKTTFLFHMLRSVLDGEPFMGQPTVKTPVVLLSEQGPQSLQQALRRAGLETRDDLFIAMWHEFNQHDWSALVYAAADVCREVGAKLLAVDTLSQWVGLHGDSENHAGAALEAVKPLQEVAARFGLGVIFNRHERKSGGDVGDSARGSSAYGGAVDVILSLRRLGQEARPTMRQLLSLSRYDETPQRVVIELQGTRYVVLGDEEQVAFDHAQYEVLGALSTEDALILEDIVELVTIKRSQVWAALKVLVATGLVRRSGHGKAGDPFRYLRVPEDPEQDTLDV